MASKPTSPEDEKLKKDVTKRVEKGISRFQKFVKELETMGITVPKEVGDALKKLNKVKNWAGSINDVGESINESSAILEAKIKDLNKACGKLDAKVEDCLGGSRNGADFAMRNYRFTLYYKNKEAISRKVVKKTIARYLPETLCKMWKECAAELKDQAKAGR